MRADARGRGALLRKSQQIGLSDGFLKHLRIADSILHEFAEEWNIDYAELAPRFVAAVVQGCLSGVGFAAEEVRGIRRPIPRSGPNAKNNRLRTTPFS
jgi:hypothetical protein